MTRASGRGLGPGNRDYFGPEKVHRAVRRVPFGTQKVGNKETELLHSEVKRHFEPFLNCLKCQSWPFFVILLTDMQRMFLFIKDLSAIPLTLEKISLKYLKGTQD
jgi:hypothetical protein